MIDFPDNPTSGQTFTRGAQSWTWDGIAWSLTGSDDQPGFLPRSGGTMTGLLQALAGVEVTGPFSAQGGSFSSPLSVGTPTAAAHAATKTYVDGLAAARPTLAEADARYLRLSGGTLTGGLTVGGAFAVSNGATITASISAAGAMSLVGALALNAGDPTQDQHAARKAYVDAQVATRLTQTQGDARYMRLTGGAFTGPVSVPADPTSSVHLARKGYVDAEIASGIATRLTQAQGDARYVGLTGDDSIAGVKTFSSAPSVTSSNRLNMTSGAGPTKELHYNGTQLGFYDRTNLRWDLQIDANGNLTPRGTMDASNLSGTLNNARLSGDYSFANLSLTGSVYPTGGVKFSNNDFLTFDDETNTYTFTADGTATASIVRAAAFVRHDGVWMVSDDTRVNAGNGMTGGGGLNSSVTITLGTPGTITSTSTNTVTTNSHTHALSALTVRQLLAEESAGSLGMYGFLKNLGSTRQPNENQAGSNLRWSDSQDGDGNTPTGSWKAFGLGSNGDATLWLRTS